MTAMVAVGTWRVEVSAEPPSAAPVALPSSVDRTILKPATNDATTIVRRLTIAPADVNGPPTCVSFFESPRQRIVGDAAPFYYRAMAEADAAVGSLSRWQARRPTIDDAQASEPTALSPLQSWVDELPAAALREFEAGARMDRCDFDWRLEDRPALERLTFPLDELIGLETLTTAVLSQSQIDVANGRFDAALSRLRVAVAATRHMSQAPSMVAHVLSFAQSRRMLDVVERWIAAPGAPNLHWALRELASAPVDRTRMIALERSTIEDLFPRLFDAEQAVRTSEQWRAVFADAAFTINELSIEPATSEDAKIGRSARLAIDGTSADQIGATMVNTTYPHAKTALLQQDLRADRLDAMPREQAVAVFASRLGRQELDEAFQPLMLPAHEALAASRRMRETLDEADAARRRDRIFAVPVGRLLGSATSTYVRASLARDRRLAALTAIEAVRDHLTTSEGETPRDLRELAGVAAPVDPLTLEPFDWKSDGQSATLTLDWPVPAEAALPIVAYQIDVKR